MRRRRGSVRDVRSDDAVCPVSHSEALSTPTGYPRHPLRGFGAQIAAHGRVAHLHCDVCTRLEQIQADSESFLRAYGMTCEDMVDGV